MCFAFIANGIAYWHSALGNLLEKWPINNKQPNNINNLPGGHCFGLSLALTLHHPHRTYLYATFPNTVALPNKTDTAGPWSPSYLGLANLPQTQDVQRHPVLVNGLAAEKLPIPSFLNYGSTKSCNCDSVVLKISMDVASIHPSLYHKIGPFALWASIMLGSFVS